jgi:peptidoglycan/xylan/chitin deacetylase (PgdA/CDA1 family)
MKNSPALLFLLVPLILVSRLQEPHPDGLVMKHGGIVRGDTTKSEIYLLFTGHEFHDGGEHILHVLEKHRINASFFFTGDFYRDPAKSRLINAAIDAGHYLGPHSDRHLLYCAWENRDSTLVTRKEFVDDMLSNFDAMAAFGIDRDVAQFFMPPFEWYNDSISAWATGMDLILVNFTPGTYSNMDYTTPDLPHYRSSSDIYNRIIAYENESSCGLNGFLLLLHAGTDPARKDKFYFRLDELLHELIRKGYGFKRLDKIFR